MLIQSVKKEAILIFNDLHSVGVLLLLPISFMLIMTLAMSEQYEDLTSKISIKLTGQQHSVFSDAFGRYITSSGFSLTDSDQHDAVLELTSGFDLALLLRRGSGHLKLTLNPALSPQSRSLITQNINVILSKVKLHAYMNETGDFDHLDSLDKKVDLVNNSADVSYLLVETEQAAVLSAPTLYSIPSWLVFGLYFIVLPISITLINERQNGTLIRIKTYPISTTHYFSNKALSYGMLSILQWVTLSIVGLLVVPLITGQPILTIGNVGLYLFAGLCVVFSAIGFAFLIASLVNTYDQAIVLGGGINILLAAISGFMVPIDIMPQELATLATFSPMYWSGEVIRQAIAGASLVDAGLYLSLLAIFGGCCFGASLMIFNIKSRKLLWN